MMSISDNLQAIRLRIAAAEKAAGRSPASVQLLAVSKTKPDADIMAAFAAGQRAFGENYVQEGCDKVHRLASAGHVIEWHFIGPLQGNKTRAVAEAFDWVHAIDRDRIAQRLSQQRDPQRPPLNVCIQVNVSAEATKSGVAPDGLGTLADAIAVLPNLRLRGLMAIPEPTDDVALQRTRFAHLRQLRDDLNRRGHDLDTLSMGMSQDMEAAIAEGATIVRVGTALFGARA
ncbi:MAG: YggS family pyridoxal phosphate-dependent enzyme [Gammaproteobacteria bacterium]|jgi:PLP dependent protein|nr:YggS family pyridoxal phosphate-dependent enzyme [Gammaproteobacteria bacterium]MBU0771350.1 YggS family pyridoxal phosphate-dependent enzyme [Gammaproteobacteria bacterium]MBU0857134.1 YggS family pyridoxal phosphate-dependent enzyme [Gammaproteobacteria bacterium]MBU1848012.1 YggS family pyridoxal phosphate-dependent enzyme [Gammaproteobacteria bacterium]